MRLAGEALASADLDVGGEDDRVGGGDGLGGDRRRAGGALGLDQDLVPGGLGRLLDRLSGHVCVRYPRGTRRDGNESSCSTHLPGDQFRRRGGVRCSSQGLAERGVYQPPRERGEDCHVIGTAVGRRRDEEDQVGRPVLGAEVDPGVGAAERERRLADVSRTARAECRSRPRARSASAPRARPRRRGTRRGRSPAPRQRVAARAGASLRHGRQRRGRGRSVQA